MSAAPRLEFASNPIPRLETGDSLTSAEFERRYAAMPGVKKAELIEGMVIMPSPVKADEHSEPQAFLVGWLFLYAHRHPEVQMGDNGTVRLDNDNNLQPDGFLRLRQHGTSHMVDGYVEGAPELAVEVAASSVSIDLHAKKRAYRRNGVREYIVWRTRDRALDWFELVDGDYIPREPGPDGVIESRAFPGLRLNVTALLAGDLETVVRTQLDG
ncbi:MAG: Uma2 family endonuclease [Dehalococcoidia bacterium]|nr:Uma2 family endonuclease [Dehalococcoidia bacterium]